MTIAGAICASVIGFNVFFASKALGLRPSSEVSKLPIALTSTSGVQNSLNSVLKVSLFGGMFPTRRTLAAAMKQSSTNSVVSSVDGIKQKRLGGSGIIVSEIGLGTQRWVSEDFNAPNEQLCFDFMDRAILSSGVNLIDTAEQYPIPSGQSKPEGFVEEVIGMCRYYKFILSIESNMVYVSGNR